MHVAAASFQSPSFGSGAEYLSRDFGAKMRFDELGLDLEISSSSKLSHDFGSEMKLEELGLVNQPRSEEIEAEGGGEEGEVEEEEEEEEEFSFVCLNPDGSPISADDAFCNGQIRPIFPLFNQDLLFADAEEGVSSSLDGPTTLRPPLRKIFVEGSDSTSFWSEPEGPYCEWTGKTVEEAAKCKKSNSTGFSKIWKLRDLVHRSNSDGKDAFVFLTQPPATKSAVERTETTEKEKSKEKGKTKKVKGSEATASAAEKHFAKGRAIREGEKRKSYLPYRQDIFGFFTSVNGFSRNIHPF